MLSNRKPLIMEAIAKVIEQGILWKQFTEAIRVIKLDYTNSTIPKKGDVRNRFFRLSVFFGLSQLQR